MMRIEQNEFEKTVNNYSDSMLRCAYTYCGNLTDAEDIVQEAFIRYLRKSPKFESETHKKAWLLRTVINLSKDLTRSFWHRKKTELTEDVIDESNSFKECEIRSAVQQLPEKFRIIVELYYGEGCTIEEITKITGIKRSTVGDRLKRAREMLRKIYEEDQR